MLKLSDLAARSDMYLGDLRVSPSRRLIEGPAGTVHLQPLVMQAFLTLLDARGEVVTRDQLFDQCWGDAPVGNESLNRVMARVRQIPSDVAPGFLDIETIPRTGYRIGGDILGHLGKGTPASGSQAGSLLVSRRRLIGGLSLAMAAAVGWFGLRAFGEASDARQFQALMSEAEIAARDFPDRRPCAPDSGARSGDPARQRPGVGPAIARSQPSHSGTDRK